jgi:hypothetical protein
MSINAIAHISRLRGGSQAQVMLADDGNKYVVKFLGNPQHDRVLANEYLACRLAQLIGLSVPEPLIIYVDERTIREQQITFTLAGRAVAPRPGPQFGSHLVTAELIFDFLPDTILGQIRTVAEFAGILAFDKWTGNADGRQVVFHKNAHQRKYTATWIDFGYCFNAGEWSFPDSPFRGTYARNEVYDHIASWDDFAPWLERIEEFSAAKLHEVADEVPCEWYGERSELESLLEQLLERCWIVRQLIEDFKASNRHPFPRWDKDAMAGPVQELAKSFATLRLNGESRARIIVLHMFTCESYENQHHLKTGRGSAARGPNYGSQRGHVHQRLAR